MHAVQAVSNVRLQVVKQSSNGHLQANLSVCNNRHRLPVQVWDMASRTLVVSIELAHKGGVTCCAIRGDGKQVCSLPHPVSAACPHALQR